MLWTDLSVLFANMPACWLLPPFTIDVQCFELQQGKGLWLPYSSPNMPLKHTSDGCLCMRQVSKMDCLVWLATFLGCLFISIDAGLGLGIALGLLFLFVRTAFPRMHILHRLPGSTFFRDAAMYRLQVGTCQHLPDSADGTEKAYI